MNGPAPPGNANAPLAKGRRDKLTGGREYSACPHSATLTEQMPRGHLHQAAVRCAYCGRHLRWLPKPETIERRRLNGFKLATLAMCDRLTSWERHFVRDSSQRKRVSPKQQEIIDRLCATYRKEAA
jgi:hypothetical protein